MIQLSYGPQATILILTQGHDNEFIKSIALRDVYHTIFQILMLLSFKGFKAD